MLAVSVSFLHFLGILPESHYYHDLKYSLVPFSHESSFLHFRIVSPDFMNYLFTPDCSLLCCLCQWPQQGEHDWMSHQSHQQLVCSVSWIMENHYTTKQFARNIYYNEGISVPKRFPLWEQKPGYLSEKCKDYKYNSRMHFLMCYMYWRHRKVIS